MAVFELSVTGYFRAAHQVRQPGGGLEPLHEHDWCVTVTVARDRLGESGMLVDFDVVRRALDEALAPLAGRNLNDLELFARRAPSAEHVALYVAEQLEPTLPPQVHLARVEVEEAPGCTVRWLAP